MTPRSNHLKKDDNYKRRNKKDDSSSSDSESSYNSEEWETDTNSESEEDDDYEEDVSENEDSSEDENKHKKKSKKEEKFRQKYKELLAEMFPSKYSRKNAGLDEDEDEDEDYEPKKISKKSSSKKSKKDKKSKKSKKDKKSKKSKKDKKKSKKDESSDEESEQEEETEEYSDEEDDSCDSSSDSENSSSESETDESDETEEKTKRKKDNNINIILSVGGKGKEQDDLYDEYADYFEHDSENDDDDEDEECDTDDEETFMKENYEKILPPESEGSNSDDNKKDNKDKKKDNKDKKKDKKDKKDKKKKEQENIIKNVEPEYIELLELKKDLTKKFHKNPKSKILKKAIDECSSDIKKLVQNARKTNTKEFKKLIIGDKSKPNEITYFKKHMSNSEQLKIMNELKNVNQYMDIDKPYRLALLESNIPSKLKAIAMQKINMLRSMDECDPEYFKIKNWVDNFMKIPFCKYSNLNLSIKDGLEKCHDFMKNAKNVLDNCVYGLDDAKLQILQMIGQWISNPEAMGTAIAINGPPGTGKTTLVKDGISKILGREFIFIPLGGAGDASFLEGHSYTYEGSTWGKIVQSLINCKCMNPVFYFDELDKISDTPKGEEITGILTHLTDTTQNTQFHDRYFSDVDFDLSKCLFIFSYNDESRVNPILKDRMYRIHTKGYDAKEKIIIANQYMLPKIREQVGFNNNEIVIPDDTIKYIVSSQHLTQNESGVRNMKRCLEIIHTKLNLFRLVKSDENMFSKDIDIKVQFPFTVNNKHVDVFIKNEEKQSQSLLSMYI